MIEHMGDLHGAHRRPCPTGGTFMTAALRRSRGYLVGGKPFPSANIDEDDPARS